MSTRLERCYAGIGGNGNGSGYDFPPPLPNSPPPPPPPKQLPPLPPLPQPPTAPRSYNGTLDSVALPLPMPILSVPGGGGRAEQAATWSQGTLHQQLGPMDTKSSSLLDSHDRFKPEKSQRRPVQKMKWSQSRWSRSLAGDLFSCSHHHSAGATGLGLNGSLANFQLPNPTSGFPSSFTPSVSFQNLPLESESRVSSMNIADVSPRIAVKKVLLLYEHAQYREAAGFIQRLSVGTFRIILRELPLDIFVEAMPHSVPIMEALYTKVFTSDGPSVSLKALKPEAVIMHMVKFFSREEMLRESRKVKETLGPFTSGCKKILQVIVVADPKITKLLQQRRKALDKAVEGMGQHGLVGTTDESLLPLHDALKLEFRRVVDAYKGALQRLEDLSLSNKNHPKTVAHGPAPIQASHQRQLSLRAEEIQDRLIKNKSLLNVVEPTLDNHCHDILLGILQRRIECDKEALFQFTQLRKEAGDITLDSVVAPLLMRYSRGCKQVLEMMREVAQEVGGACLEDYEDDSSDLSGYHSDSDSAIMTSGNSPYVSPRARYNFLSRSVRSKAMIRPSIMLSGAASTSSGVSSGGVSPRSGSSGSSLPDAGGRDFISPPTLNTAPIRPRHVKHKNQLYKNNSLVSTSSSGESESSGSLRSAEFRPSLGCIDCVTVVSVPDNQVITQGVNHRCGIPNPPAATSPTAPDSPNDRDRLVNELRNEINQLRRGLQAATLTITHLQEREKKVIASSRFEETALRPVGSERDVKDKEDTRNHWIREYGALYAQARVETMDALDALQDLVTADELKSKLLFSVVVLSFRAVQANLTEITKRVQGVLQMDPAWAVNKRFSTAPNLNPATHHTCGHRSGPTGQTIGPKNSPLISDLGTQLLQGRVLQVIGDYLGNSGSRFDLSKAVEQVANQLWTTLYDYPCLKKCEGLMKYIRTCVNLAWGLSNLTPPCVLEYETRVFTREMHVRFHSSDQNSDTIKTYLWPALVQGPNGPCVHKGVVIT